MLVKCKILSPIHIRKEAYIKHFSFVQDKNKDIYIFDEFDCFEYINNFDLKKIKDCAKRKIRSHFEINKEEIFTFMDYVKENRYKVYLPGSSIKGAIRTTFENKSISNLDKKFQKVRVNDVKGDFITKIYKSINIKICKNFQEDRIKTDRILQFVECLIPNQEFIFEINIGDFSINNFIKIMNDFYFYKYLDDTSKARTCKIENKKCENCEDKNEYLECDLYFYNKSLPILNKNELNKNKKFLLNLGHFGGAVKKSIDRRKIFSKCGKKNNKFTTTKTFALEKDSTSLFFENELVPFGWIICEIS